MAMKSKKELRKAKREKFKELYGEYPEAKFVSGEGCGKLPRRSRKDYKITNQKGAFGKVKVHPTFDPNETNKMRFNRRKMERELDKTGIGRKTIIDGAKELLTKVLGE
jgi:hypothetical protein